MEWNMDEPRSWNNCPTSGSEDVWMTPEDAKELLKKRDHQRPMSNPHVLSLLSQMKMGLWRMNGEVLVVCKGRLLDGQHRLAALGFYGKPLLMRVSYVEDESVFTTINTGRTRQGGDMVAIAMQNPDMPGGISSPCAYAIRIVIATSDGNTSPDMIKKVTNTHISEFTTKNPRIVEICESVVRLKKRAIKYQASHMTALCFLVEPKFPDVFEKFVSPITTGLNLTANTGQYLFREKCLASPVPSDFRENISKLMVLWKAWNLHASGGQMKRLVYSKKENPPRLFGSF